jgi:hypothetical protein
MKYVHHAGSGGPRDRCCGNFSEVGASGPAIVHITRPNKMLLLAPDNWSDTRTDTAPQ